MRDESICRRRSVKAYSFLRPHSLICLGRAPTICLFHCILISCSLLQLPFYDWDVRWRGVGTERNWRWRRKHPPHFAGSTHSGRTKEGIVCGVAAGKEPIHHPVFGLVTLVCGAKRRSERTFRRETWSTKAELLTSQVWWWSRLLSLQLLVMFSSQSDRVSITSQTPQRISLTPCSHSPPEDHAIRQQSPAQLSPQRVRLVLRSVWIKVFWGSRSCQESILRLMVTICCRPGSFHSAIPAAWLDKRQTSVAHLRLPRSVSLHLQPICSRDADLLLTLTSDLPCVRRHPPRRLTTHPETIKSWPRPYWNAWSNTILNKKHNVWETYKPEKMYSWYTMLGVTYWKSNSNLCKYNENKYTLFAIMQ